MGILLVSLANFIIGSIIGPSDIEEISKGFIGFDCTYITYILEINCYIDNYISHTRLYEFFNSLPYVFVLATEIPFLFKMRLKKLIIFLQPLPFIQGFKNTFLLIKIHQNWYLKLK